jgi:fatty-acyl-CoA synthase
MITRQAAVAGLGQLMGIGDSDRVATFCWNHHQHLEALPGDSLLRAMLHTLNLRLHENDLTYIATHAGDKAVIVDEVLWDLFDKFRQTVPFEHVIVVRSSDKPLPPGTLDYEALLADVDESQFVYKELDERQPRPCVTPRARPACPRACWLRTARSCCTRWPAPCQTR